MSDSTKAGLREDAPHAQNRSAEELAMRDAIEAWGRQRWPDARVVHELVTGECRIDMAFVQPHHLIGVEIKSSRDTLDRLNAQTSEFARTLPEVWLAVAPKWLDGLEAAPWRIGRLAVTAKGVSASVKGLPGKPRSWGHDARLDRALTVPMLGLLWRAELMSVAMRSAVCGVGSRAPRDRLIDALARALTGDEIVAEVCRELRARDAFWRADPPIREASAGIPVQGGDDVG